MKIKHREGLFPGLFPTAGEKPGTEKELQGDLDVPIRQYRQEHQNCNKSEKWQHPGKIENDAGCTEGNQYEHLQGYVNQVR